MKLSEKEKQRLQTKYGPWALITGSSSGIGKELAIQCASAGLNLILVARGETVLNELADQLEKAYSIQVAVHRADVSDREQTNRLLQFSVAYDIGLFIAAAGFGTSGEFRNGNVEEELDMLKVNCASVLEMTHHFAQRFAEKKRGGIILFSSLVAFQGVPFAAHYAATKAYIQSLAEAIAIELKPFGVDVLSAAPGPVRSGFGDRANMQMEMAIDVSEVGVPILNALGRKTTVLPGMLTKVLIYSLKTVPRWAKVLIMKQVMGGMTAHQR